MDKISVSVRLDTALIEKIDNLAKARNLTRSKAIIMMLESTKIIILSEGTEILKLLHILSSEADFMEGVLEELWQLLSSTTEKIQQISAE